MRYVVRVEDVVSRPTAVVAAATTWAEFAGLWKPLLDEVWECLRANGVRGGCRNVMFYKDGVPNVEIGVELNRPLRLTGRVIESALPAGRVATTVHYGPYSGLSAAHDAVAAWCASNGHPTAGPRWEVYGPHREDPSELATEISWLLGSRG